MKKVAITFFLLTLSFFVFSQAITLNGIYQGKNLLVMNPFASSGVGFCVYEVRVNSQVTTDEINSSAFEIDLSLFQLKIGDPINVVIKHKENCVPKVLNPEVLKPKSTFYVSSIKVKRDGKLYWTTTGESGSLPFIVEQFRWNKWVKIGTVEGIGTPDAHEYSIDVRPHCLDNRFRVKQIDYTKKPNYSKEAKYRSMDPCVTYEPVKKIKNEIVFSAVTMYEIYNPFGNLLIKGTGNKVDVSSLKRLEENEYILHYDNKVAKFNIAKK